LWISGDGVYSLSSIKTILFERQITKIAKGDCYTSPFAGLNDLNEILNGSF
jgi:hypothetical protein